MRVAIVGCGLIGQKRARALAGARLVVACDTDPAKAEALGVEAVSNHRTAVTRGDVDVVIVATTHDKLAEIGAAAARAGKHVLIEKPGARRARELEPLAEAAKKAGVLVRVGFNHRYHPAMQKARELLPSLGPMMFLRARYGHGGRVGYEKEWRADPEIAGGGELIDQGIHLIDLSRWYLGDFEGVQGHVGTFFWEMPVEDNCFLILRTPAGQVAWLHASWSEWKNMFSLELYGRHGKLVVDGLGGSYGTETLTYYKMKPGMGPPDVETWEFDQADSSWEAEFAEFLEDIRLGRKPSPGLDDARAALEIVGRVYGE